MGSRAVVVICRDENAARRRFGVVGEGLGVVYTRTGRPFFDDRSVEHALLDVLGTSLARSEFWSRLDTDWVCLDCELMPWSAKAQELIRTQYAPVGAAATSALPVAIRALDDASTRGLDVHALRARFAERASLAERYVDAYQRYCWPVAGIADLRLAPFHIMATEGAVHVDKSHEWHLAQVGEIAAADASGVMFRTNSRRVDLTDPSSEAEATAWWETLTAAGGEGMVVKPLGFVAEGPRGLAQPAIKCRGREYLRIIYGPEYTLPANLDRLRSRAVNAKRGLALREFALGIEALERFVRGEPLRRVHECVFGVLALESEPIDPRL